MLVESKKRFCKRVFMVQREKVDNQSEVYMKFNEKGKQEINAMARLFCNLLKVLKVLEKPNEELPKCLSIR